MKIGFVFLTVNEIKNIDVWQQWFANATCEYQIFIHSKKKYNDYPDHSVFKDKLIPAYAATNWGVLAKAQMYLWSNALAEGCDYAVLLSDKCLPLNQFEFLHFDLMKNEGKSYMHYQNPWWPKNSYRKGRPDFEMKGAPQWTIIHKNHLKILSTSHAILHNIRKYCIHPDDECYPATTLNHFDLLNDEHVIRNHTTFANWERKTSDGRHPYTFVKLTDYDCELLKEKSTTQFFVRKFEELSMIDKNKILDILNERLFDSNYSWKNDSLAKLATTK